jgi:hypothetical protein
MNAALQSFHSAKVQKKGECAKHSPKNKLKK